MTTPVTLCRTCRHWLPKETPAWAWESMDMAVCAKKNTKAVTMAHWAACEDHDRAESGDIAWRKAVMKTRATPRSGSSGQGPSEGNSNRVVSLVHGFGKG